MARRKLNECASCSYTWHPRDHNVSTKCPKCGGRYIGIAKDASTVGRSPMWLVLLIVSGPIAVLLGIFYVGGYLKHLEPFLCAALCIASVVVVFALAFVRSRGGE